MFPDILGSKIIFRGPPSSAHNPRHNIDLLLDEENHDSYSILSITGAFSCKYFCRECLVRHEKSDRHRCINVCRKCRSEECLGNEFSVKTTCKKF
jgi:hypothetical protein